MGCVGSYFRSATIFLFWLFLIPSENLLAQLSVSYELGCPRIFQDPTTDEVRIVHHQGEMLIYNAGPNRRVELWAHDPILDTHTVKRKVYTSGYFAMTQIHAETGAEGPEFTRVADFFMGVSSSIAMIVDHDNSQVHYLVYVNPTEIVCERHEGEALPPTLPGTTLVGTGISAVITANDMLLQARSDLDLASERILGLESELSLEKDENGRCLEATTRLVDKVNERDVSLEQCRAKRDAAIDITNLLYQGTDGLRKDLKKFRKANQLSSSMNSLVVAVMKRIRKVLRSAVKAAEESRQ